MDREARRFWREQRRRAARERRRTHPGEDVPVTYMLLGALLVFFLVQAIRPSLVASLTETPILALLLSALNVTNILSLVFLGFFVYVIGMQLEGLDQPWKLFLIFFGSSIASSLVLGLLLGTFFWPSFAGFGLAGAYASLLFGNAWGARDQALRWAGGLLLLNAILGGLQPLNLLGMLSAFAAGFLLARLVHFGGLR